SDRTLRASATATGPRAFSRADAEIVFAQLSIQRLAIISGSSSQEDRVKEPKANGREKGTECQFKSAPRQLVGEPHADICCKNSCWHEEEQSHQRDESDRIRRQTGLSPPCQNVTDRPRDG